MLCDAVGMADLTTSFLKRNPDLFADSSSVPINAIMKGYFDMIWKL
jgi:hypothetical protein